MEERQVIFPATNRGPWINFEPDVNAAITGTAAACTREPCCNMADARSNR
jgi:hypothetical protein